MSETSSRQVLEFLQIVDYERLKEFLSTLMMSSSINSVKADFNQDGKGGRATAVRELNAAEAYALKAD